MFPRQLHITLLARLPLHSSHLHRTPNEERRLTAAALRNGSLHALISFLLDLYKFQYSDANSRIYFQTHLPLVIQLERNVQSILVQQKLLKNKFTQNFNQTSSHHNSLLWYKFNSKINNSTLGHRFNSIYLSIYLWLYSPCESWRLFEFLIHTQPVELLGRGISPSQGRYLHTEPYKHRINAHRHPCLEWDSNPRS
jgi:hypothetical protein